MSKSHTLLSLALLAAPLLASAAPVPYTMTFTPTLGPGGTGSLLWDATAGAITNFTWTIDNPSGAAFVGGMGDFYDGQKIFTDLPGRYGEFIFEMLSETNVYPDEDCSDICSGTAPVVSGVGALGTNYFGIWGDASPGGARYEFSTLVGSNETLKAWGLVTVAPASVPLPAAAWLLLSGAGGMLTLARRRRAAAT